MRDDTPVDPHPMGAANESTERRFKTKQPTLVRRFPAPRIDLERCPRHAAPCTRIILSPNRCCAPVARVGSAQIRPAPHGRTAGNEPTTERRAPPRTHGNTHPRDTRFHAPSIHSCHTRKGQQNPLPQDSDTRRPSLRRLSMHADPRPDEPCPKTAHALLHTRSSPAERTSPRNSTQTGQRLAQSPFTDCPSTAAKEEKRIEKSKQTKAKHTTRARSHCHTVRAARATAP
ncbi:hypothetical protein B0H14DRAFT_3468668 [Mycena olivaceomarginata]|nr:hypothetical protein B0H14DRAFT_3468668 [Mycena olivaceomarginata]